MILDARTIALLFVDGLSAALIVVLVWLALRARLGRRPAGELEDLGQLLALTAGALLALRIVAWAFFFLVLDGYVPSLADNGVMCAFGVVQLLPALAHSVLWAKPAVIGCLLVWWSLAAAERDVTGAPFLRLRFAAIAPIAALVALEIAGEASWLFAEKLTLAVTCCSAALDPARTINEFQSSSFLGLSSDWLLAVLFLSKFLLIGLCVLVARKQPPLLFPWTVSLCAVSGAIAFLDLIAWREAIAPRALGLEFHRCAYELVTRSVGMGPAALLATLAHLGLVSLPVLALVREVEPQGTRGTAQRITALAALLLTTELVVVAAHIL